METLNLYAVVKYIYILNYNCTKLLKLLYLRETPNEIVVGKIGAVLELRERTNKRSPRRSIWTSEGTMECLVDTLIA